MTGYGQFCAVARAHEVLGGRWTLLVLREILCGASRFAEIRRGIPRISKTMLAERLAELVAIGAIERRDQGDGPEYRATEAGREAMPIVAALAVWGQRHLPRHAAAEDLDLDPVLVDMARRVRAAHLPAVPMVVRVELAGLPRRFLLLKGGESTACLINPGFPEPVAIRGRLDALVAWWRGDAGFAEARRQGLVLEGDRALVRAFPGWFDRYAFAAIHPAATARARSGDPVP